MGDLRRWVSDNLMSLLGYSHPKIVQFVIMLSTKATSPSQIVKRLADLGISSSTQLPLFAEEIFARVERKSTSGPTLYQLRELEAATLAIKPNNNKLLESDMEEHSHGKKFRKRSELRDDTDDEAVVRKVRGRTFYDEGDTLSQAKILEFDGLLRKTLDTATQLEESTDFMELDDGCDANYNIGDGFSAEVVEESFSVPGYLRKVFMDELNDDCGRDHKLMVVAIHAVFSESGFVGFDRNSNKQVSCFQFKNDWPSGCFMLSVSYTLPDIVARGDAIDCVMLKFHSLGNFMCVYGSLRGHSTHSLKLNEDQLVPLFNVVWANCGVTESIKGLDGGVLSTSPEKELFKFWKYVKDNLALPLLIGLCEKTGLELPPCFIRLPMDLKMKILELLPGVDVAKISCVCSELRYLASSEDLWKLKFTEQFQNERTEGCARWKKAFAAVVRWRRKIEEMLIRAELRTRMMRHPIPAAPRRIMYPNPFIVPQGPHIIGGHAISPVLGDNTLARLHDPVNPPMRNFSPPCKLGGGQLGKTAENLSELRRWSGCR